MEEGVRLFLRVVAEDLSEVSLAWLVSCIRIQDRGSIRSFDFFPITEELQGSMGIAKGILGVLAVTDDKIIVASFLLEFARGLESRLDQAKLFSAILNRPVAASLANDFKLLEQRALVPLQANLGNLAGLVERNEMSLDEERDRSVNLFAICIILFDE